MDKNNREHSVHSGGFASGFFVGIVLGGLIVFLLGTKKGKQILKTLAENGFEGISDLGELLDDDEEDDGEYEEYIDDSPGPEEVPVSDGDLAPVPVVHEKRVVVVHHHPRPHKRLFKGVKR